MKISIIGAGNMGGAIVRGLCRRGLASSCEIRVVDVDLSKLAQLAGDCPAIRTDVDSLNVVSDADVIVLAVKPWLYGEVIGRMKDCVDLKRQAVVSIAAGVGLADLRALFEVPAGKDVSLFRVMPNIAIEYCESINFITYDRPDKDQVAVVDRLFSELGKVMYLKESLWGAATALGSCGVAFAMRYVRASVTGGVEFGLTAEQSQQIMTQTLKGVVALLESSDRHIESLIDSVCTPGGVTIKGLNKMEEEGFTRSVQAGIRAVK